MYEPLAILAVFALAYSILAGGIERTAISGPIVFMLFGLAVGPSGLGLLTFGAAVVGPTLASVSWQVVLYAALSLTVVRMLPVFLCLLGLGADTETKLFVGWFGPRGLASIVFAVIVVGAELPNGELVTHVVAFTVLLSIVLHGVTANPWARAFGARHDSGPAAP